MAEQIPGRDYVGVGVGALIVDAGGRLFMAQRGPQARNEAGCWEFPGGRVEFGERMEQALRREIEEEYGITISVTEQIGAVDHLLPDEGQHWISITFLARLVGGTPTIREPHKCSAIGWFRAGAMPEPLSIVTQDNLRSYQARYGSEVSPEA
ncbi:MAG TPA: NUDIX domain-containing protein [Roseiflexaceae bacterium]|nr:NUDIX domain-containing protein [Roseiflexaceae bacterium]